MRAGSTWQIIGWMCAPLDFRRLTPLAVGAYLPLHSVSAPTFHLRGIL